MGEIISNEPLDLREVLASPTQSFDDEIEKMGQVEALLPLHGLQHAVEFARIYRHLTEGVRDRALGLHGEEKTFKEKEILQRAVRNFAGFWYDPVDRVLAPDVPRVEVWDHLLVDKRALKADPAIQFSLGMGTHIKRDLPLMLDSLLKSPAEAEAYFDDFINVDDLIYVTAHDLSKDMFMMPSWLRRRVIDRVAKEISNWRSEAWDNYVLLRECNGNIEARKEFIDHLERQAKRSNELALTLGQSALNVIELPWRTLNRFTSDSP